MGEQYEPPDALTDRTLYHLCACRDSDRELDADEDLQEVVGPEDSSWADLLAAIMEGLSRGWIEEAHLTREDGVTHLRWSSTSRGERAMDTYLRRRANAKLDRPQAEG